VNLIESNPITKLNGNYQSKLIEKVKNHFTEYEQQMFIASFYCYLNCDYKNDFVIDLDNIWKWLGFSQKVNAKILLEKQFTLNVDFTQSLLLQQKQTTATKGGQNKEIFMLNVNTFKKFCLKAGTKKADEIHDYFIKLENVLQEILFEESDELKLQLEQQKTSTQLLADKNKLEYETKLVNQKVIEREKILLNTYGTIGSIFYVIKVKTYDNKQYVIKVGESRRGITDRYKEHKNKHEECILLDCFAVNKSKDFETFIKEHDLIRPNKVKNLPGHETDLELFLIGKNLSYQTLLNIINNNIKYFNNNDNSKLELENEQLKLMLEMKTSNNDNMLIQELIKTVKDLSHKVDGLSHKVDAVENSNKINAHETKVVTGFSEPLLTVGPRLQKINPETMMLIKVYETVSELMKENSNIKRPSINKAVIENTIYCGYRWLLVDRELDPNIIHNITPTKQTKAQNLGYIAQINKEQTKIVNVFLDRKTAAHFNGYESTSALDTPVKKFTLSQGYYYKIYDDCDETFREEFEEQINGMPLLYKNGVGQYDLQNNLIREFSCKYDCLKTLLMSDKTLAKALDKEKQYNGFYYKSIGSKLKCV
jgi:phage anti-repressor protein